MSSVCVWTCPAQRLMFGVQQEDCSTNAVPGRRNCGHHSSSWCGEQPVQGNNGGNRDVVDWPGPAVHAASVPSPPRSRLHRPTHPYDLPTPRKTPSWWHRTSRWCRFEVAATLTALTQSACVRTSSRKHPTQRTIASLRGSRQCVMHRIVSTNLM